MNCDVVVAGDALAQAEQGTLGQAKSVAGEKNVLSKGDGELSEKQQKSSSSASRPPQGTTAHSAPFLGSARCFVALTRDLGVTGLIMALSYVCEKHPPFAASSKHYDRDLFLFVCILFFGYAWYTRAPVAGGEHQVPPPILGRAQTEEWKGWMQFVFLMYHYFHAAEVCTCARARSCTTLPSKHSLELLLLLFASTTTTDGDVCVHTNISSGPNFAGVCVCVRCCVWARMTNIHTHIHIHTYKRQVYNSVRVMITCYVWMTGFGNFSFFYFRRDFGWLRVTQMLWRLNFAVVLLLLWHGNTFVCFLFCFLRLQRQGP